jgi:hypothetical protein
MPLFQIVEEIVRIALEHRAVIIKETFASFGVDGRTSFTVGRQHGAIDLALYRAKLRVIEVRPSEWQKKVHLNRSPGLKPKFLSSQTALELFPAEDFRRLTKRGKKSSIEHDGLIDATLIAYYGVLLLSHEAACG